MQSPIKIKVGEPLGHMGLYQYHGSKDVKNRYIIHLELISADQNLETSIGSKDKLTEEKYTESLDYLKVRESNPIARYQIDTTQTPTVAILLSEKTKIGYVLDKTDIPRVL